MVLCVILGSLLELCPFICKMGVVILFHRLPAKTEGESPNKTLSTACDECCVMYGREESLYCAPETIITCSVNWN